MSNIKFFILGLISLTTVAYAQGPWTLGGAVLVTPDLYKGRQDRFYPVPIIGYEGDRFYFRGYHAGYYLWKDKTDELSVIAYYSPLHFRPKDSNNNSMRTLNYRKSTAMGGLSYIHDSEYGSLRTILAGDILDNSNGIIWDSAWLYRYASGGLTLTPGIGVAWNSKNQNKYYYGVDSSEASRSGFETYDPSSSWSPYMELSVRYQLTDDWNLFAMGRYIHLPDEVTSSPMVDKKWTGILLSGMTYSF